MIKFSRVFRLWKRDSADANGQTGYHIVRDSGHAVVSVVPVQHRRHTGQELQVDIREMLPLPELQETPKTHVGHTAKGTVEGIYLYITSDGAMPLNNIIIILYVKCNKNNNKYYNIPAVACAALSIVNQK